MRWLLLACALVVIAASALAAYGIAKAGTSTTVSITATGWVGQCVGPSDLVATKLSDHSVLLTWTLGLGANNTIIRRAFGACPSSTVGTEVYNGNASTVVDYIDLTTLDTYVCWRAYTVCGNVGNISYSSGYAEARLIGGVTVMYIAIFGLCLGMSWMALRGRFLLWNIAAAVSWAVLWMYVQGNPMSGVVEGDATHTVMMLVPIVALIAVMVHGLGRQVEVQKDYKEGLTLKSTFEKFKFFGEKEEGEEPRETSRESKERELEEYRAKFGGALRNRRYTEGKRRR